MQHINPTVKKKKKGSTSPYGHFKQELEPQWEVRAEYKREASLQKTAS